VHWRSRGLRTCAPGRQAALLAVRSVAGGATKEAPMTHHATIVESRADTGRLHAALR
jgi:hypothetical protein